MRSKIKRILSIEGGGIKGVMPAAFLAHMEEQMGKRIVDHFDLIVGTSTGGIIALGLGLGIPASDILAMYRDRGAEIFYQEINAWVDRVLSSHLNRLRRVKHFLKPKYSPERLRGVLTEVFGTRILGQSQTRLVIPAYHAVQRNLYVFKTAHHPRLQTDWRNQVVDVAMATAAAPTYLPSHVLPSGAELIDGGVWANNPVGPAVVEAVGVLGWSADRIRVLSLGCTEDTYTIGGQVGKKDVMRSVVDLFMQGQSKGSIGTAKILLRDSPTAPKLFEYTHIAERNMFELDNVSMIEKLAGLGAANARQAVPVMNEVFLTEPREQFVPYHGPGARDEISPEVASDR